MSSRFPAVTAKQIVRILQKVGFVFYRSGKGSHEFYIRERDRKIVMVSRHSGEIIRRGTLSNILEAAGLSLDDLRNFL
jgi:predicted RNA binding protein YcfA (HicA-like mRNA interferase family)